jgi:prepilin-type processing-associated H-X9-DG protein
MKTAKRIQCAGNFRQIFAATSIYTGDNNSNWPVKENSGVDNKYWSVKLGDYLQPEGSRAQIWKHFSCPSVDTPYDSANWNLIDYAFNYYFLFYPDFGTSIYDNYKKLLRGETKHSETIYCMESSRICGHQYILASHTSAPSYYARVFPHLGQSNVCFFDGHVSGLKQPDVPADVNTRFWQSK